MIPSRCPSFPILTLSQDLPKPFEWVEFFAGEAQATEQMKYYGGRTTARLDIIYMSDRHGVPGTNPMDITSPCGMANLGSIQKKFCYIIILLV